MKKILNEKLSSPQKAFTLIELLIVIAVAGILAAAIITAINPVKRINQANDANIKSDIAQIANAMQTYLTARGAEGTAFYPAEVIALVTSGELKSEPKYKGTTSYVVTAKNPPGCTTAGQDCTDVAVSHPLNEPLTVGNVWCWRSPTAVAAETTVAACTAAP